MRTVVFRKPGSTGIAADVGHDAVEMFGVPDNAIVTFSEPNRTDSGSAFRQFVCSEAFPTFPDGVKVLIAQRFHNGKEVVRHDDVSEEVVAVVIEVLKGRGDECGIVAFTEKT